MSSINLLPKNFGFKENKKRQEKIIIICSVFLVFISLLSYFVAHAHRTIVLKESDSLDLRMEGINNNIEKEINSKELFLTVDKIRDIRELLNDHRYFSKVFNIIQNVITEDVYLTESELVFNEDEDLTLRVSGVANSYLAAVNQIVVFKNSYWIDDVEIDSIATDDNVANSDDGISFSGILKFKKDIVLFREYYWDFGLALLSSEVDRYIRINDYSAKLIKESSDSKNLILVEFGGVAYGKERLILFEENLKQAKVSIKDISISRDLDEENDDELIKFRGKIELELF